jgi:hypothetical protein
VTRVASRQFEACFDEATIVIARVNRDRAQTHATFPLLFNALYPSALGDAPVKTSN